MRKNTTTIREVVAAELKRCGRRGAKAAEIRQRVEQRMGRRVHDKTVGMTLYRLSLSGKAKRSGLVWSAGRSAAARTGRRPSRKPWRDHYAERRAQSS